MAGLNFGQDVRDTYGERGRYMQLPPSPDGAISYGYSNTQPQNRFGDIGGQMGNEEIDTARAMFNNLGMVTSQVLPDQWSDTTKQRLSYLPDAGLAALLAMYGTALKGIGYGSELVAGDTSSERRLANDLAAYLDIGSPELAMMQAPIAAGTQYAKNAALHSRRTSPQTAWAMLTGE